MTAPNPHQRAVNTHAVAERRVTRATNRVAALTALLAEAKHDLMLAQRRLDHAAASPDLPEPVGEVEGL